MTVKKPETRKQWFDKLTKLVMVMSLRAKRGNLEQDAKARSMKISKSLSSVMASP